MKKIEVNTASTEELALVAGLNETLAARLVRLREKSPFEGVDDLIERLDIDTRFLPWLRDLLCFGDEGETDRPAVDDVNLQWLVRKEIWDVVGDVSLTVANAVQEQALLQLQTFAFLAGAGQAETLATWEDILTETMTRGEVRDYIDVLTKIVARWEKKSRETLGDINLSVVLLTRVGEALAKAELLEAGSPGSADRKQVVKLIVHALSKLSGLKDLAILQFLVRNAQVTVPGNIVTQLLTALKLLWTGSAGRAKIDEIERALRELDPESADKALDELQDIDPDAED